tara:strand:+ start:404 stop:1015 length:612 start_codon:yes stop_codon:yes gene_type:complete
VEIVPIPPAFPIPQAFSIPAQPLDTPEFSLPAWITPPNRLDNIKELIPPNVPERNNQKEETSEESKDTEEEDKENEEEKSEEPVFEGIAPPIDTPKIQIPFPLQQQNQQQDEAESEFENSVIIPGIDYEMPLPSTEVMVTAATTASIAAVVSVTGTLAAKTVFDYLLKLIKPALKVAVNKLAKARGKPTTSWARQRLQERRHK